MLSAQALRQYEQNALKSIDFRSIKSKLEGIMFIAFKKVRDKPIIKNKFRFGREAQQSRFSQVHVLVHSLYFGINKPAVVDLAFGCGSVTKER